MKLLKLFTIVLGLAFLMPMAANASTDDFEGVTVEAIELDDNSSDSVTHEVEVPHEEERDDHHARDHMHEKEDEHENEHEMEDNHNEGPEDSHEVEDHADASDGGSVS